jgi:ATP phosphoribosyltransferase
MSQTRKPAPLVLAVPSKGRLQENAFSFFSRAGLNFVQGRGARDYRGVLREIPGVEVAFLSASEIVQQLASGAAHLGVTGEDLVRESLANSEDHVTLLTPLGFGHANVIVAVPQAWIDVRTMADLEDVAAAFRARRGERMRVATKYVNSTRRFFAEKGVTDYRIVESLGATEGAPLKANALKILDDGIMLCSQANLVASRAANWDSGTLDMARAILSRICAEEDARTSREVRARIGGDRALLLREIDAAFGARAPLGASTELLSLVCPAD